MSIKLEMKRTFQASQEALFKAFTEPEVMKQWFAPEGMTVPRAEMDAKVGGAYIIEMKEAGGEIHRVAGKVQEYQPHERISYTWQWDKPDSSETLVTFTFQGNEKETEVTLLHENFKKEEFRDKHNEGWVGCLNSLACFLKG